MNGLLSDFRYGLRALRERPTFTAVAVATVALGIGANSAMFSVVDALLLEPLPYADPDRLVLLWENSKQLEGMSVAYPNFVDWRALNRVFERMAAYQYVSLNLTGAGRPERIQAARVSADLFALLGVAPQLGRGFVPAEDRVGAERVAVISHGLWRRRWGDEVAIIGRTLRLDGQPYTVVGVMPAGFRYPPFLTDVELWTPIGPWADTMAERGNHPGIYVSARLRPGVELDRARGEMRTIARRLERAYPDTNTGNSVGVDRLHHQKVEAIQPALLLLLAAVGFVLLIACANVANLLLARALSRQQEIALRQALGASRWRLARQLLTEAGMLGLIGGAAGLVLAIYGLRLLVHWIPPRLAQSSTIAIDERVLAFTLAVSLITGLLFGVVPALQATRRAPLAALKEGGRSAIGGRQRHRARTTMMVAQVALALLLLIGAGLMMRSFIRLAATSPGFDPSGVVALRIALPEAQYPQAEQQERFFTTLIDDLRTLPQIELVAATLPLLGGWQTSFLVEGRPRPAHGEFPLCDIARVSEDYFKLMRIPLLRGRVFDRRDRADSTPVAVVDTTMAERFWPGQDPIGKRLNLDTHPDSEAPWIEIVGVVGHVKNYGVAGESRVEVYLPYRQSAIGEMALLVRGPAAHDALAATVQRRVWGLDPDQPVFEARPLEQTVGERIGSQRLAAFLLAGFAGAALLLAAVGIYGVLAYAVGQRTHEIGVRMALGARRPQVLRWVVGQGLGYALIGIAIGLAAALGLTRLLASQLYGVSATDPWTFALVPAILMLVALLAAYLPARRAARVDPLIALRYE